MSRIDLIKKTVSSYEESFLEDLRFLIAQESWRDEDTITSATPFGKGVVKTFDIMKSFCKREGLVIESAGNYAFHATLERGDDPALALAGHLDTVPIHDPDQWISPPLHLREENGMLYGLGVNDDKGPSLVCLYTLKLIHQLDLLPKYSLRVIYGGAEETTWECIQEYRKQFSDPDFVIVSDGNFPLVHIEKGILRLRFSLPLEGLGSLKTTIDYGVLCQQLSVDYKGEISTYQAERIPSRHPYRGRDALNLWALEQEGAIFDFLRFWDDGRGGDCAYEKEDIPNNASNTFALIGAKGENENLELYADVRYMSLEDRDKILVVLQKQIGALQGKMTIDLERPLIAENPKGILVQSLLSSYQDVTGDRTSQPLIMGAMSYARAFSRALAFGPCFPQFDPFSHRANECMPLQDLLDTIVIYTESILRFYENIINKEYNNE